MDAVADRLGQRKEAADDDDEVSKRRSRRSAARSPKAWTRIKRLVVVDQKPIGRTPRSNLATYTGLLDHVRKLFAATKQARARRYDAGRFSFNVAKGRCETCRAKASSASNCSFFRASTRLARPVRAPATTPRRSRSSIATSRSPTCCAMTVDGAFEFFADDEPLQRSLGVLREVGLGYIRLGQSATELSGGEAQRVKLATELQRAQRGDTLYVLDEPTTGLHPVRRREADDRNSKGSLQPETRSSSWSTTCPSSAASDWIIDIGPGAGDEGGTIVASGSPKEVAAISRSRTARYLAECLGDATHHE